MSTTTIIYCKGCEKKLTPSTILKHLSHRPDCMQKYSELEFGELKAESLRAFKLKKKIWKQKNKEAHTKTNAKQYKRTKLKFYADYLKNTQNAYFVGESEIMKDFDLDTESRQHLIDIKENMENKFKELQVKIELLLRNTTISDDQLKQIPNEWDPIIHRGHSFLNEIRKKFDSSFEVLPSKVKVMCKSCSKPFLENTIMKHLANNGQCKDYYEKSNELKFLKERAVKKEKERLCKRYQNDKEKAKIQGDYEQFLRSKNDLDKKPEQRFNEANFAIRCLKNGYEGYRCRKEIEKFRKSQNHEVLEAMTKTETLISSTIQELELSLNEVLDEVSNVIGHFEFDNAGLWRQKCRVDLDFCNDMFKNVSYHINDVFDTTYITALQTFYDHAENEGIELEKPLLGDSGFCRPYRYDTITPGWNKIPRTVVLKIPNKSE